MKKRLSIVDTAVSGDGDHYVLIEESRIVRRRLNQAGSGENLPRTRADKVFPWNGSERIRDAGI
jgi:hypothetical protein